jgi:hypothetical protein
MDRVVQHFTRTRGYIAPHLRLHRRNLRTVRPVAWLRQRSLYLDGDAMSTIPEPWKSAMVRAGMTDPRYRDPRPSFGQVAGAANLHTTTVSRMVYGTAASSPGVIASVAKVLGVDPVVVSQWAHRARSVTAPYQVPDEVHQLDEREQRALTELIRAMAAAKESEPRGNTPATSGAAADRGGVLIAIVDAVTAGLPLPPIPKPLLPRRGGRQ